MDAAQVPLHRLTGQRWLPLAAALLILLGAALRFVMLSQDVRFFSDEALYAGFARQISLHGDVLLRDAPLDKPPLALFLTALSFSIFEPTEFAARLPSVFASILTLAITAALAHRLYSGPTGLVLLVLLLLALSPLDLAFAATAYLDPLLTLWLLLACLAASHDHWRTSGFALALAIGTKQSALFFAPLILIIGIGCTALSTWRWSDVRRRLRRFILPVIGIGLLFAAWSAARAAPVDFWTLGAANNNPSRLIRAGEVLPRLVRWTYLLGYTVGFVPLLITGLLPVLAGIRQPRRDVLIDVLLTTGLLALLLAYWLFAFNTYDRYLHPVGPLILLLVARGLRRLGKPASALAILCVLPATLAMLNGQVVDIGGDHQQHTGIERLASAIHALPDGAIVYDFALGWELSYYLGDQPAVRIVFEPSPQALVRAVCTSGNPSYFVTPASSTAAWLSPLRAQQASITERFGGPLQLFEIACTPNDRF